MSTRRLTTRPADNPFSSHRVERLAYRNTGHSLQELARRVRDLGGRVAIVGPKGSGKTTLLEMLVSALPGQPVLVRIPRGRGSLFRAVQSLLPRPVASDHELLVDGGEQLGPLRWRQLLRAATPAQSLVVTLHRPGRLPTLIECRTDHALLHALVTELVPEDAPGLEPRLAGLFNRHDGNIRSCFRELYDLYAGRSSFEF